MATCLCSKDNGLPKKTKKCQNPDEIYSLAAVQLRKNDVSAWVSALLTASDSEWSGANSHSRILHVPNVEEFQQPTYCSRLIDVDVV